MNDAADTESRSHGAYRAELVRQLWEYTTSAGLRPSLFEQTYQRNPHRPPVFRRGAWHHNLLLPPGKDAEKVREWLSRKPRHRWFRSMTSSQALAWSVFGSLTVLGRLGLLSNVPSGDAGEPLFPPEVLRGNECEVEFEVGFLGEPRPTSVDALLGGNAVPRVAVECKLSEPDVGTCSRPRLRPADPSYGEQHCTGHYSRQRGRRDRCALTTIGVQYWRHLPNLTSWPADKDAEDCPLRPTYQLARNVLAVCAKPDGSTDLQGGHCVLLFDRRNPAFNEGGRGYRAVASFSASLKKKRLLRLATWQDILVLLRGDARLHWLADGLTSKYGF